MFISKTSCCWWNAFFCHINVCTLFGRVSLYVYGWLVHCLGKKFADNLTNGFSKYLNFIIIAKFVYDYYNENKKCLPFMLNIFDIFFGYCNCIKDNTNFCNWYSANNYLRVYLNVILFERWTVCATQNMSFLHGVFIISNGCHSCIREFKSNLLGKNLSVFRRGLSSRGIRGSN